MRTFIFGTSTTLAPNWLPGLFVHCGAMDVMPLASHLKLDGETLMGWLREKREEIFHS